MDWGRVRSYRLSGIVLHRRDHGEADRLITLLTPDRGKVVFRAPGVRKVTSRKAGHLELFTHVRVQVAKGRTWDVITQAETLHAFPHIRGSLKRTGHAYFVAELLLRFAPEGQGDPALFDLALKTFHYVDQAPNLLLVSRWFEAQVLRLAGFQPQLYTCVACHTPLSMGEALHWFPPGGGVLCPSCATGQEAARPLPPRVLKLMRFLQDHTFEEVSHPPIPLDLLREVESYMLDYLRTVLERDLRSMTFIRRLRRELKANASPPLSSTLTLQQETAEPEES